ncbi:hypothetical protein [Pelagibaculum spongiae]|uniref:DUF4960 domain-containing protein n=1 Tax=Pelagibaculum spongiae TaxID=2080658 RepID=A0A2V1GYU9_9GAMM|nr:hypothetical protein [Pelagibaculum spongiae]PVZ66309.1 hypothetical protein DC094_16540 [Pelagibaculum spongiae]
MKYIKSFYLLASFVLISCHNGNDSPHPPLRSQLCGDDNTCQVASVARSRISSAWTLDGGSLTETRLKLLSLDNFGPQGTSRKTINIIDSDETFTLESLRNFDLLFIGYWDERAENYLTTEELNAMTSWVMEGGRLIITCDSTGFDATCSHFGYPVTAANFNFAVPALDQSLHPVLNGLFNAKDINNASIALTEIRTSSSKSFFANTDNTTILGYTLPIADSGQATIMEHKLGSGIVMLLGDVDYVSDITLSHGETINSNNQNDIFMANLFDYMLSSQ